MLILVETIMIIAYMINGTIGVALMFSIILVMAVRKDKKLLEKLLILCSMSIPMSFIGILGMNMHHIFSWYNIFMFLLLCHLIKKRKGYIKINCTLVLLIFILINVLSINILRNYDIKKSITEIIQILMMVLPVFLIHCYRGVPQISEIDIEKHLSFFSDICIASSIATVFQYVIYFFVGKEVGFIWLTALGKRVICNCLFKGMSILSIYFGLGFMIIVVRLTKKKNIRISEKIKLLFGLIIIMEGLIVNTSRTGIAGIALAIAVYFSIELIKYPDVKKIMFMFMCAIVIIIAINYMVKVRGNFFDENGRIETYRAGLKIWKENLTNFFIGGGLTDEIWIEQGTMTSHNMIFQSLAQCGIIGTFIFMSLFIYYFWKNRYTPYISLIVYLIITGMAVTDFYANTFTTLILCLVDILGNFSEKRYIRDHA